MSIQSATPYLHLNGRVEEAITLYQRALGARTEVLQRFGDVDGSCPEALRDRVMHAEVRIGQALLMMSDAVSDKVSEVVGDKAPEPGANMSVALQFEDPTQLRRSFEALASSGTVIEPVIDAPWGGLFGALRDAFGIHWMVSCAPSKK